MVNNIQQKKLELRQGNISFIPPDWKLTKVSEVFTIRNNLRKPISEDIRKDNFGIYPYYGPTKIQGHINEYNQDGEYALIGEDGDHFIKYNTLPMTQLISGKCTVNNHAHIIEGTHLAIREWFYYYFMHKSVFSFLTRQGAGRYKLNKSSLEKIPLVCPPIQEQKKIAEILSTWDEAIATTEQQIENSVLQKKALMQQLLTGKKRLLDDDGKPFRGKWLHDQLANYGECLRGVSYKPESIQLLLSPKSAYLMRSNNIQKNTIIKENLVIIPKDLIKSNQFVKHRDLVICMANGSKELVGKSAQYNSDKYHYTVGAFCALFRSFSNIDSNFTKFLFQSMRYKRQIKIIVSGSSINNLKTSDILNLNFNFPPLKEQQKIAAVLTAADEEIEQLKTKLCALQQEKQALMQQLLTGKRRVCV